jgi:S-adenosylmethionine:tRNA ribosyltransferase-isomerase
LDPLTALAAVKIVVVVCLYTADYEYKLPPELIARHPPAQRDASRMLVLRRDGNTIEHRRFTDFPDFIHANEMVVLNDTRVVPARVFTDDRKIELLLLAEVAPHVWKCLVKPGRKMRKGASISLGDRRGVVRTVCEEGARIIAFDGPLDLERHGELPLPPYLQRAPDAADRERYQTVFARAAGAVAAPTAGLHFTPEILAKVPHAFITLHVGIGTFRPVQTEMIDAHRMHAEEYSVSASAASAINDASKVFAVGTTCARVLETCGRPLRAHRGATDIFIHPPHTFRAVDALLTNFHLPRSTLLMLVSAFAGREFVLRAYAEAIAERYRFYSYGDCMLIL